MGERRKMNYYGGRVSPNSLSSGKRFANRTRTSSSRILQDKSHKIVYQIDSNGDIVRKWDSIYDISEKIKVHPKTIKDYIDNEKIVGGCLLVFMTHYKSTIDYCILIKYIKYKNKND